MTGVSPITLDDVTSGFNIGENISIDKAFNEMMGFREQEVIEMIEYYRTAGEIRHETGHLLGMMNRWYNHYRFSRESTLTLFNPTLVLHFLKEYQKKQEIPDELIDRNVRMDYDKLKHLVIIDRRGDKKANGNFSKLKAVIEKSQVNSKLEKAFPLKKMDHPVNFYSLLFYFGLLTIKGLGKKEQLRLTIPNETVKKLFYEYITEIYTETDVFSLDLYRYYQLMEDMAYKGKWKPLFDYIGQRMETSLSLRDLIRGEKSIQAFLYVYLGLSDLYILHSEKELGKGYADILLEPFIAKYQGVKFSYLIEIKYMKAFKNKEQEREKVKQLNADAERQLNRYGKDEKYKKQMANTTVIKLALVFSGHRLVDIDEINNG